MGIGRGNEGIPVVLTAVFAATGAAMLSHSSSIQDGVAAVAAQAMAGASEPAGDAAVGQWSCSGWPALSHD
jgi:hypothetical protein